MAKFFPSIEILQNIKVSPTEGELDIIHFLNENLNDEYEIYFQPFLNGDRPDIILVRRNGGVLIIEVKDWNLDSYFIDDRKRWHVKPLGSLIRSPINQVLQYKENLYDLHIGELLDLKLKDFRYWYIVNCAIFFSKESRNRVRTFLLEPFNLQRAACSVRQGNQEQFKRIEEAEDRYIRFLDKNINLIGTDTLTPSSFQDILSKTWISKRSFLFSDSLYNSFQRYLKPPFHSFEDGRVYNFTKKQESFAESKPGDQKIKGIVGSGKTLVLARRAVNAYKRTTSKVLILTYNISLKNYIHDRISSIREDFYWENFHIVNYHDFFNSTLNNLGIQFDIPLEFDSFSSSQKEHFFESNYYGNLNLFDDYQDQIEKYSTILIDEVQDYTTVWLRLIKKYFLLPDAEFVVFGDSKQDIYNRVGFVNLKKELVIPESPGRWGELNQSFRLTPVITSFAAMFQKEFLSINHQLDDFEPGEIQTAIFDRVRYKYFDSISYPETVDFIIDFSKKNGCHPNDICILSLSVEIIRELDFSFRNKSKENSYIMAESKELFEEASQKYGQSKAFRDEIERIRKNRKVNFWMNSGLTKFSTIHSFKGWEIQTLFLIIQPNFLETTYTELIYTGFTRCMNNLVIINIGDHRFDQFVSQTKLAE